MNSLRILINICAIFVLISVAGCGGKGGDDGDDAADDKPAFDVKEISPLGQIEVDSLASSSSFFGETSSTILDFTSDGQYLMVNTSDNLQIYSVATIADETVESVATIAGESFELSPDNRWLVEKQETEIQIFDLAMLSESPTLTPVSTISGDDFSFSPDSLWLIVTSESGYAVYDLATLSESSEPVTTISGESFVFSPDDRWLVVKQETAYLFFDVASLGTSSDPAATIEGDSYRFSADGMKLAIYDDESDELKYFDLAASGLSESADAVIDNVTGASFGFSPDGTILLLLTETSVDFWHVESQERTSYEWDADGISWRFSPDGSLVVLYTTPCSPGYCSGAMRILQTDTLEERFAETFDDIYVDDRAFSADGHFLAYGTSTTGSWSNFNQRGTTFEAGTLHLVNLENGEEVQTIENQNGVLGDIFFNSDATQLIFNTLTWTSQNPEWSSATVHLINVENGEEVWATQGHGLASGFNDDESQILSSSTLILPGLWTSGGGNYSLDVKTGMEINAQAVSSDGRLVVQAVQDSNELSFYDGETKDLWGTMAVEGATELSQIVLSSDGTQLVTQYTEVTEGAEGESSDTTYILAVYSLPALPESE